MEPSKMTTELVYTLTEERLTHRKASLEEFWALPESTLPTEYINGEIIMAPTPTARHQSVAREIFVALDGFVRQKELGRIFFAPLDVLLPSGEVVQPDIFFLTTEETERAHSATRVYGVPSFVVEILSPGSVKHDAITKRHLYETNGVREYWIVDPETKTVSQLIPHEGHYALKEVAEAGVIRSTVLSGFEASVAQFFIL
jgi:Uma2 family endonuclease